MSNMDMMKKGPWSSEEDEKLVTYIRRYGIWNWNHMAAPAGIARSGKSCRLRWMNYLRPNIRHGNFTPEEEEIIIEMQRTHGNKWALISSKLKERTDNEVKNYWNTRLKKRFLEDNRKKKTTYPEITYPEMLFQDIWDNQLLYSTTSVYESSVMISSSTQEGFTSPYALQESLDLEQYGFNYNLWEN